MGLAGFSQLLLPHAVTKLNAGFLEGAQPATSLTISAPGVTSADAGAFRGVASQLQELTLVAPLLGTMPDLLFAELASL